MSEKFEDDLIPGGGGAAPTKEITIAVFNRMLRLRGEASTKKVLDELKALDYKTSKSSVGRMLEGVEGRKKAPEHLNNAEKRRQRARQNNRDQHKERDHGNGPAKEPKEPKKLSEVTAALLEGFAESDEIDKARKLASDETYSASQLAIQQNRYRMALGVVMSQTLMENPRAALVDPRGIAALMDAITVSAKLSGGAAIDVKPSSQPNGSVDMPVNGVSPNGHAMKEINPPAVKSPLLDGLAQFRRERAAANGARN